MRVEKTVHFNDPGEDWFVVATQAHWVPAFFEDYEGFEPREAEVRLVERDVRLNKLEFGEQPCWAQLSDLEVLGFEKSYSESQVRPQRRRLCRPATIYPRQRVEESCGSFGI